MAFTTIPDLLLLDPPVLNPAMVYSPRLLTWDLSRSMSLLRLLRMDNGHPMHTTGKPFSTTAT